MREVDIDRIVLIKFFFVLRQCCMQFYETNKLELGGENIICQVDESLFRHKPKNHRGRATNNELWVFGIADTSFSPSKISLNLVADRSAQTLLPIISSVCKPNTIIISDEWRAYNGVSNLNMEHRTVNHSLFFVDPNTNSNTQTIESYWAKVKYRIKMQKGFYGSCLEEYLFEWMWKDNEGKSWQNLIYLIKNYY